MFQDEKKTVQCLKFIKLPLHNALVNASQNLVKLPTHYFVDFLLSQIAITSSIPATNMKPAAR